MTMPGWYRTEMLDGSDYAMHRLTESDLREQGWVRKEELDQMRQERDSWKTSFVHAESDKDLLTNDLKHQQAELEELREYKQESMEMYATPTALIRETREVLKSVGFQVPQGCHLLGSVIEALKHHAGRAKEFKDKFDVMEQTLMVERDQAITARNAAVERAKVWENNSGKWAKKFGMCELELKGVGAKLAGLKALESINKMQEGMINASNQNIRELEERIKLLEVSRNLCKDASSTNYERARAAELKLIKASINSGVQQAVESHRINNPCAHCGEQIPITDAALYHAGEGYGVHFACESAWDEKNGRKQDG